MFVEPGTWRSRLTNRIQLDTVAAYTLVLTEEFRDWLRTLPDGQARGRIAARLRLAENGNLGDWCALRGSLSEMRVHVGPGYRLYFTRRGATILVMLAGGNKSTQTRDIARAVEMLRSLEN
jgi:putative addiction module killer protein